MKKIWTLIALSILYESSCFPQNNAQNDIVIFDSIRAMKPVGSMVLSTEYKSFLQTLNKSVLKKDTSLLLSLVAENIEIAAGGGIYGKDKFLSNFLRNTDENAWLFLSNVLHMGGIIEEDRIIFPYQRSSLFSHESEAIDTIFCAPYCIYFGIEKTIKLYKNASDKSEVILIMNYPILIRLNCDVYDENEFLPMSTYDRKYSGWVYRRMVRSDADRILEIKKVKNELKISSITPFD